MAKKQKPRATMVAQPAAAAEAPPLQPNHGWAYYRTTGVLSGVVGRVTGRRYTCTPKTLLRAPEGEFEGNPNVKIETRK